MAPDASAAAMSVSLVGTVGVGVADTVTAAVADAEGNGAGDWEGEQLTTRMPTRRAAASRSDRSGTKWSLPCDAETGGDGRVHCRLLCAWNSNAGSRCSLSTRIERADRTGQWDSRPRNSVAEPLSQIAARLGFRGTASEHRTFPAGRFANCRARTTTLLSRSWRLAPHATSRDVSREH